MPNRLIVIYGQEGVGKSTITPRLRNYIKNSAAIDAEDLSQFNPWTHSRNDFDLIWKNIVSLTKNFWEAGYNNVIAGSFFDYYSEFNNFLKLLSEETFEIILIQLCARKDVRDIRRAKRNKIYNKEESEFIDINFPEDNTIGRSSIDHQCIRINNENQSIDETIHEILKEINTHSKCKVFM